MRPISFKRHRFPSEIIRHAIWLYARFTLSFRDVEELLAERGIDASYETVRRWFVKFGPSIAANIRRSRPGPPLGPPLSSPAPGPASGPPPVWGAAAGGPPGEASPPGVFACTAVRPSA